jgi:PmbA protein
MTTDQFLHDLMDAARSAGLDSAEAYVMGDSSFSCKATQGQITDYSVNDTRGVGFRGMVNGKIGYAATEALDASAIGALIKGVKESAELSEDDSGADLFCGETEYPAVEAYNAALDGVAVQDKLDLCLNMEKAALAYDQRVGSVPYCMVGTESGSVRLVNTYGLDIAYKHNYYMAFLMPIAKEDADVSTAGSFRCGSDFSALSAEELGREAAGKAIFSLHGKPVSSGSHRAIIKNDTMAELFNAFAGIFSAESAQEGMSLLSGKEGECIAAPIVTLLDDPLLKNGLRSRPFDAEGVACRTKAVVEGGVLRTLLHNRKTAKKQGVLSTGNAGKAGYAGTMRVAPTNFFFAPGGASLQALEAGMGEGLVITELEGLHSGANPVSGDFSLAAKGYTVTGGVKTAPIEQITIAGNFYSLLKNIRAVGNDLSFPGSGIGSPSVDIGEISVAGL